MTWDDDNENVLSVLQGGHLSNHSLYHFQERFPVLVDNGATGTSRLIRIARIFRHVQRSASSVAEQFLQHGDTEDASLWRTVATDVGQTARYIMYRQYTAPGFIPQRWAYHMREEFLHELRELGEDEETIAAIQRASASVFSVRGVFRPDIIERLVNTVQQIPPDQTAMLALCRFRPLSGAVFSCCSLIIYCKHMYACVCLLVFVLPQFLPLGQKSCFCLEWGRV